MWCPLDLESKNAYEAVERARFVMKMKAQGHKLDAIAEMVRVRWPDTRRLQG